MAIPHPIRNAIAAWRSTTLSAMSHRFSSVLDKAIPTLLNRADKASSDNLRNAYFHAQQELLRHRDKVQRRFDEALSSRMLNEPTTDSGKPAPSSGELKLVNPDTFERMVVLQNLSDRAEQQYHSVLFELTHRLSALHKGAVVSPAHVPGSPRQLMDSFDDATYKLDIEHAAWQVFAAVFDRVLLRQITVDYHALNRALRDAGILKDLKPEIHKQAGGNGAKSTPQSPEGANATDNDSGNSDADVDQIRALLGGAPAGDSPAGRQTTDSAGTGAAPHQLRAEDIAALIETQNPKLAALLPEHGLFSPATGDLRIGRDQLVDSQRAMRAQRESIKAEVGADNLSRFDESTIDIIGALFESMLDESDLAAPIKALLSHMHTPYLRLAMREPELLTNAGHPARQLLDEMVRAGETWGDMENPGAGIFPALKEIVEAVRDTNAIERRHLEQWRSRLLRQTGELRRRRDLRLQREAEAEKGRARLEAARALVAETIDDLIVSEQPCQPCAEFLLGPWHDYLTLLVVRNKGQTGGDGWAASEALGGQIARLGRRFSVGTMPAQGLDALHGHLSRGLGHLIPHYQSQIDEFVDTLRALRDNPPAAPPAQQKPQRAKPAARARPEHIDPPLNETEAALLPEVRNIAAGSEYRLLGDDDRPPRLLSVAWYNANTDHVLFVDQHGARADLISAERLARMLADGKAYASSQETREPFVTRTLRKLREYLESHRWSHQGDHP